MFLLLSAFYNCVMIFILYFCLSIKFCLSNLSHTDTILFLAPVFPTALLAISICNLYTSAIVSHGKMIVGTAGVKLFPVCRSFSSQIGFNMCFHFQLFWLLVLFHFRHCFSLRHLLNALSYIIIIIPIDENFIIRSCCYY